MNTQALNVNKALETSLSFIERVTTKSGKGVTSRLGVDKASALDLDIAWLSMYGGGDCSVKNRAMEIVSNEATRKEIFYHHFNGDDNRVRAELCDENEAVINFMLECLEGAGNSKQVMDNIENKGNFSPITFEGMLLDEEIGNVFYGYLIRTYSIKPITLPKGSCTELASKIEHLSLLCSEYNYDDKKITNGEGNLSSARIDEVSKARKIIMKGVREINPNANIPTETIPALSSHVENAAMYLWLERGIAIPSIKKTIARKLCMTVFGLKAIALYDKFIRIYVNLLEDIASVCQDPGTSDLRELCRFTPVFEGALDMVNAIAAMHGDDFSFIFENMEGISPYTLRMSYHPAIADLVARLRNGMAEIGDDGVLIENKTSDCGSTMSHRVEGGSTVAIPKTPVVKGVVQQSGSAGPLFDQIF